MHNQHGRKMLYYGLIYPFLSSGIVVWGHCAKARTKIIFILQKKGSKVYCKIRTFIIV